MLISASAFATTIDNWLEKMNYCKKRSNNPIGGVRLSCELSLLFALSLVLLACGDNDLEQLHRKEILAAQSDQSSQLQVPDLGAGIDGETPAGNEIPSVSETDSIISVSELVFFDEFSGGAIDRDKWLTRYAWGAERLLPGEKQYYVDTQSTPDFGYNPFVLDGETLSITADITPPDLLNDALNQSYLSGVLTSYGKFDFVNGYVEMRARIPAGKGYWPGFLLLGTEFVDLKPQLYVMENRGDETGTVYHRYNFSDANNVFQTSEILQSPGGDYSADFHNYGVLWNADSITYYIDGVKRHTFAHNNISKQKMYLIMNLAVDGWFPGSPDENTVFPGQFVIDYVRVYQAN